MTNLIVVLEYERDGQWHIYDTLAGHPDHFLTTGIGPAASGATMNIDLGPQLAGASRTAASANWYLTKFDPRTRRHGLPLGWNLNANVTAANVHPLPVTSGTEGIKRNEPFSTTARSGSTAPSNQRNLSANLDESSSWGLWPVGGKNLVSPPSTTNPMTFTNVGDDDNIVRPADWYLNSTNNPIGSVANLANTSLRPVVLQRPFRSVSELGHVFRDNAWKSLSFFDETSGDSALLDLFSVGEEPVVTAGRLNSANTRSVILESILTGVSRSSDGANPLTGGEASTVSSAWFHYLTGNPVTNISEVADFISSSPDPVPAESGNRNLLKQRREVLAGALANVAQTRTWNLLIDVVAQIGRIPANSTGSQQFITEGERRQWVNIAIDRFTGKIIAQQTELGDL